MRKAIVQTRKPASGGDAGQGTLGANDRRSTGAQNHGDPQKTAGHRGKAVAEPPKSGVGFARCE